MDDQLSLITGSNLNPRAWALDLENGMLLRDPHRLRCERFAAERANILQHTRRLTPFQRAGNSYRIILDAVNAYYPHSAF